MEGDISLPPITPEPEYERKVILECPVAGIGFYDIEEIWNELYVGAKLALVRKPKNKYDKNAVAVALVADYEEDSQDFDFILAQLQRSSTVIILHVMQLRFEKFRVGTTDFSERGADWRIECDSA